MKTVCKRPSGTGLNYLKLIPLVVLLNSFSAQASVVSSQGLLLSDDEIVTFNLSLAESGTVSARSWSFGGGVNGAGNMIAAGGFAPVLSLFSGEGTQELLAVAQAGAGGSCPAGAGVDPSSGFCWDVGLSSTLNPGQYFFTLTQDDNTPIGPFFSDGYTRSGQGNFTGPSFLGADGQCILVDGSQRNCGWAVDITTQVSSVPLPGALGLLALGIGTLFSPALRATARRQTLLRS